MAGTDFSHLTNDELIKGIQALKLPNYIRSKAYGIDVRETLAQMAEMTIQLGVNMGLSPDDALAWARKLQNFDAQLAQTEDNVNRRVDTLVINSGNANAEVTDAHVSTVKQKTFSTLRNRFEELEEQVHIIGDRPLTLSDITYNPLDVTVSLTNDELSYTIVGSKFFTLTTFPSDIKRFEFQYVGGQQWVVLGKASETKFVAVGIGTNDKGVNITGRLVHFTAHDTYTRLNSTVYTTPAIGDKIEVVMIGDVTTIKKNGVELFKIVKSEYPSATSWTENILGFSISESVKYAKNVVFKESGLSLADVVLNMKEEVNKVTSPLVGMEINFLGDSITDPSHSAATKKYHAYLQEMAGIVPNVYGIAGTEISTGGTYSNPMVTRYVGMSKTAHLITVFGGINDYLHNAELGSFESRDNATFYGAVHNLCVGLYTNFPNAKYAFFTPMQTNGNYGDGMNQNTKGYKVSDYVKAIKEVCAYYSIPVLDLNAVSGITPYVPTAKSKYMPDGLHPNNEGHAVISKKILTFIESIV